MGVIKVSATGEAFKVPDKITINFGFFFKENDYTTVLRKGTDSVKEFKNILKNIKINNVPYISEDIIKTDGFKITENYKEVAIDKKNEYGRYITEKVLDGFIYRQNLKIEFDYVIEYVEILLSEISDIDIFSKVDISFGIKDRESLSDEAMIDAVKKCRRKAELLADATKQKIEELKEISYDVPTNYHYANCAMMDSESFSESVKNKISLCDVLNPEPIRTTESVICIFKVEDNE